MRLLILVILASCSACQSVEFHVAHSMTGMHVTAKFEAKDGPTDAGQDPQLIAAQ